MTPILRPAIPDDAPGIARVHSQSWRETYAGRMPADLLARMTDEAATARRETNWRRSVSENPTGVWVAVQHGEVLAFGAVGPARDHPGYDAELMTLYSLKAAQGGGTGRALLHALANAARSGGAANLALWVLDVNPTRQWYARQGAREAGEKQDGDLREVRMVWDSLDWVRPE